MDKYEAEFLRHVKKLSAKVGGAYSNAVNQVAISVRSLKCKGKPFQLSDYPALKKKVDAILSGLNSEIYTIVANGIEQSWDLSNKKNNLLVDRRLAGKKPSTKAIKLLYDPNAEALGSFLSRKANGLNLSQRVWRSVRPFKKELEQSIGMMVGDGIPAKGYAKELKKYLNEPDRLYRRVRGEDGKLRLSAAARQYNPGQGVYRSSYKNALRLTRTENNIAYRTADNVRWGQLPFITGIQVKLSAQHPVFDICDSLQGTYPKDFLFTGWHPQCICYQTSLMLSDREYEKIEDAILAGEEPNVPASKYVSNTPAAFKKYVNENKERIKGWSNTPYWVKDNLRYMVKGFK